MNELLRNYYGKKIHEYKDDTAFVLNFAQKDWRERLNAKERELKRLKLSMPERFESAKDYLDKL